MAECPVDDYIDSLDEPRRSRVSEIYALARAAAPDAVQGTKYAMPALVLDGLGIWSVMSTKKHVGIYPYSGSVIDRYRDELLSRGITTTKGAIQLPDDVDVPTDILRAILDDKLDGGPR